MSGSTQYRSKLQYTGLLPLLALYLMTFMQGPAGMGDGSADDDSDSWQEADSDESDAEEAAIDKVSLSAAIISIMMQEVHHDTKVKKCFLPLPDLVSTITVRLN